jgi:hypothetical protein
VLKAFGPLMGFLKAWLDCVIMSWVPILCIRFSLIFGVIFGPCGLAVNSIMCASYLLQPFYECHPPRSAIRLLAASILRILFCDSPRFYLCLLSFFASFFSVPLRAELRQRDICHTAPEIPDVLQDYHSQFDNRHGILHSIHRAM